MVSCSPRGSRVPVAFDTAELLQLMGSVYFSSSSSSSACPRLSSSLSLSYINDRA